MKYFLPTLLSIVFLIVGILTLSDYGINWDGPVHMMRGQAFAHFYLTGQNSYGLSPRLSPMIIKPGEIASRYYYIPEERDKPIDSLPERPLFKAEFENLQKKFGRISFYQDDTWGGKYFIANDQPHLPLIDILSAFSNRLFYGFLGILGDIESYQLVYLVICSLGVFIVSLFAYEITRSFWASLIAGIALALFPLYFAEAHLNAKDPEVAVFFLGSIWAFYHWVKGDKLGRLGVLGWFGMFIMFVAFSLATKWNIIFLPFILIPWLILIRKTEQFKNWFKLRRLGILGFLGILGIIIFLIITWPAAWNDPAGKLIETIVYYFHIGTATDKLQPEGFIFLGFNFYPLILSFLQIPEIILALVIVGVVGKIREKGGELKIGYLLLLWLVVALLRTSLPGANAYSGMRQFMEIVPAMALLAGIGGFYLVKRVKNTIIIITIITIITVMLALPIIKLHPNENAYFNNFLKLIPQDDKDLLYDWGLTYGNVYKQAVNWLNTHAEKDANLVHLAGPDYSISPLWLRDDISLSPNHFSGYDRKGEYLITLFNPLKPHVFAKRYIEKFLVPIYQIKTGDATLLSIYKNDSGNPIREKAITNFVVKPVHGQENDYWQIDLDQEYKIIRLLVNNKDSTCSQQFGKGEFIFFLPEGTPAGRLDLSKAAILNERRVVGGGIEYIFEGEVAKQILIFPRNEYSCFNKGKIIQVSVLE